MGLGYIQLAVKSATDAYLVGNPQFTYFKKAFVRHTPFAMEPMYLNFQGDTTNGFGKKFYCKIPRNADLLYRLYIQFEIKNNGTSWADSFGDEGQSLIEFVDVFIGDQQIDRQYGEWLHIAGELFEPSGKSRVLSELIKIDNTSISTASQTVIVPMRFWFCRNPGLALPLMALAYQDVRIDLQVATKEKVRNNSSGVPYINNIKLICDYIHLSPEEKLLFSSSTHEYIIEQIQSNLGNAIPLQLTNPVIGDTAYENTTFNFDVRFNHPVKELFWVVQDNQDASGNTANGNYVFNFWRNFTAGRDQIKEALISLNGKDGMEFLPGIYYRNLQTFLYHDNGCYSLTNYTNSGSGIYKFSFALYPQRLQSSGTLNFSGLENCRLKIKFYRDVDNFTLGGETNITSKTLRIYGINYNVLRIQSGSAGLGYIN